MIKNEYSSLAELQIRETENKDYQIVTRSATPETAVIAIHGGGIEEGTSELADAIADKDYSFYAFIGIKQKGNKILHLDSRVFIEPRCLAIVNKATQVISVHGCNTSVKGDIFLGGKDDKLKKFIEQHLTATGFSVARTTPVRIAAQDKDNICNRTAGENGGVQIEIQAALRAQMFAGNYKRRNDRENPTAVFKKFVAAIRTAISENNEIKSR